MVANVRPGFDAVLLVLPVNNLTHSRDKFAVLVIIKQRVPVISPDDFNAIPSGPAERRFELLNDLTIAANRTVQPLQVAIDDPDKVVQSFTRAQRNRAQSLRFVTFSVTDETPDVRSGRVQDPTVLQISQKPSVIDRTKRSKAHRDSGKLPEIRHQPRMRIG